MGDNLGVLKQRQQRQVIHGLRVLYGDLVEAEAVQLRRQQVVVGLGRLGEHVRVEPVRVTATEVHRLQYSTVQYSTVQYSTVQYSTVQYSTVQYSTVQSITCCRSSRILVLAWSVLWPTSSASTKS